MSHFGIRGPEFINYVSSILKLGGLKDEYIEEILSTEEKVLMFESAFNSAAFDSDNNYEALEFLGDATINKIVVWYLSRRFPNFLTKDGVKTLARLKINLIQKVFFARIARELGMERFISCTEDEWTAQQTKLLEDCMEAFIGAIEYQIDSTIFMGTGYAICYRIVSQVLDKIDISTKLEDLYDEKTRLKEVFDSFNKILGKVEYGNAEKISDDLWSVEVYSVLGDTKASIGKGTGKSSKGALIDASEKALLFLSNKGFVTLKSNENFLGKLPRYTKTITNKGTHLVAAISVGAKRALGVGYDEQSALQRAAYNMIQQL